MILNLLDNSKPLDLDNLVLIDGSEPYTRDAFPEDGLINFNFTDYTVLYSEVRTYFQYDELLGKTLEEISTLRNVIFENRVLAFTEDGYTVKGSDLFDYVFGSAGDDVLYDKGPDRFRGGAGNDTYYVTDANTDVSEGLIIIPGPNDPDGPFVNFDRDAGGIDLVISSVAYTLPDYIENLTLVGSVLGTGNKLDNVITGDGVSNNLRGEAGNDRLIGGGGNDTVDGGSGVDTFVLSGSRADYVFTRQPGTSVAEAAVSVAHTTTGLSDGVDQLRSIEVIEFAGGNLAPAGSIQGTGANNLFNGTAGADSFFFDTALGIPAGADVIRGFGVGDRIITTSLISDPNGDGRVRADSSDRFVLPTFEGETDAGPTSSLKIFSNTGVFSHLQLVDEHVEQGVTFYSYATLNDLQSSSGLLF